MKTTSPSDRALLVGESLIGAAHAGQRQRNQDAIKVQTYSYGSVAAVADGVGSHRYAEYGSQAVVQAVHEVFAQYARRDMDRTQIVRAIAGRYVELVQAQYRAWAGTTCIFFAHLYEEGLFLGQVGDGICCGYLNGAPFCLGEKEEAFSNLVAPLSAAGGPPPLWRTRFVPKGELRSVELMLATDGVSDDLLPGQEAAFARYLIGRVTDCGAGARQETLRQILEQWETPLSQDDKTIGLYRYTEDRAGGA